MSAVRDAKWRARYETHLRSEKWRQTRGKVFSRAHFICEGCGECPGVDVHHKTYEHLGDELLFELVLLCERCHDRVHANRLRLVPPMPVTEEPSMPTSWEEMRRQQGLPADGAALLAEMRRR